MKNREKYGEISLLRKFELQICTKYSNLIQIEKVRSREASGKNKTKHDLKKKNLLIFLLNSWVKQPFVGLHTTAVSDVIQLKFYHLRLSLLKDKK